MGALLNLPRIALAIAVALATASSLLAQTLTMAPYPESRTTLDVRYLHILPNKGNATLSDGVLDLTVSVPIG